MLERYLRSDALSVATPSSRSPSFSTTRLSTGTHVCDTRIRGLQGADCAARLNQQLYLGDPLDVTGLVESADICEHAGDWRGDEPDR